MGTINSFRSNFGATRRYYYIGSSFKCNPLAQFQDLDKQRKQRNDARQERRNDGETEVSEDEGDIVTSLGLGSNSDTVRSPQFSTVSREQALPGESNKSIIFDAEAKKNVFHNCDSSIPQAIRDLVQYN